MSRSSLHGHAIHFHDSRECKHIIHQETNKQHQATPYITNRCESDDLSCFASVDVCVGHLVEEPLCVCVGMCVNILFKT